MTKSVPQVPVRDNQAKSRFECEVEGHLAICSYDLEPGCITLTHTVVPGALEGRGIGSALARGALEAARERDLRVVPQCAFIRSYIDRHPEYADLLDAPGTPDR